MHLDRPHGLKRGKVPLPLLQSFDDLSPHEKLSVGDERPRKQQLRPIDFSSVSGAPRIGELDFQSQSQSQSQKTLNFLKSRNPNCQRQTLAQMREKKLSQNSNHLSSQSQSQYSDGDYMTPQDQPVQTRTDNMLTEQVANQRVTHQSRVEPQTGLSSVSSIVEGLPKQLPRNPFLSIQSTLNRNTKRVVRESTLSGITSRFYGEFGDIEEIGIGTFGKVYRAVSKIDGNAYAVKVLRRSIRYAGALKLGALLRETHAMSYISNNSASQCSHLLRYYQCWIEGELLYMQTQLCSGGSISGRKMLEQQLSLLCKQMCIALQHMHALGVAHLDVKPENILETSPNSNAFVLADFGLCSAIDSSAHERDICVNEGDSRYLAQELLNEDFQALHKADIFALGASLLELGLGSKLPSSGSAYHQLRMGDIPHLSGMSDNMNTLLASMLHPNAAERPSPETIMLCLGACCVDTTLFRNEQAIKCALERIAHLEGELAHAKTKSEALEKEFTQRLRAMQLYST